MSITRTKTNWSYREPLTSTQLNALDTNVTNALDKRSGQTDTCASNVTFTGSETFSGSVDLAGTSTVTLKGTTTVSTGSTFVANLNTAASSINLSSGSVITAAAGSSISTNVGGVNTIATGGQFNVNNGAVATFYSGSSDRHYTDTVYYNGAQGRFATPRTLAQMVPAATYVRLNPSVTTISQNVVEYFQGYSRSGITFNAFQAVNIALIDIPNPPHGATMTGVTIYYKINGTVRTPQFRLQINVLSSPLTSPNAGGTGMLNGTQQVPTYTDYTSILNATFTPVNNTTIDALNNQYTILIQEEYGTNSQYGNYVYGVKLTYTTTNLHNLGSAVLL